MSPIVRARGVGVRLDGETLLPPVDFRVGEGEALAVVGPNGAGKTTLLRVLAALLAPTSGSVEIDGASPDERSREFRRRVAALIGIPPFAGGLVIRETLALIGASWGRTRPEAAADADRVLAELGIGRLATRFPHELSAGQTQLCALAATLVRPSSVLLLDEPEHHLDPDRIGLVGAALARRASHGSALVFATHSTQLAGGLADRRLLLAGSPDDGNE